MKTFYKVILGMGIMLLTACYSSDDSFRSIELKVEDPFVLENSESYVVGDTLFFEVNFSRYLDEEGQSNKLDIFESTAAESFAYDLQFGRFSDGLNTFQSTSISPQLIFAEKGSISDNGSTSTIGILLNPAQDRYESRIGVVLAEPGRFRLDFRFTTFTTDIFVRDKVILRIRGIYTGDPSDFEYTVTE